MKYLTQELQNPNLNLCSEEKKYWLRAQIEKEIEKSYSEKDSLHWWIAETKNMFHLGNTMPPTFFHLFSESFSPTLELR